MTKEKVQDSKLPLTVILRTVYRFKSQIVGADSMLGLHENTRSPLIMALNGQSIVTTTISYVPKLMFFTHFNRIIYIYILLLIFSS